MIQRISLSKLRNVNSAVTTSTHDQTSNSLRQNFHFSFTNLCKSHYQREFVNYELKLNLTLRI